MKEIGEKLRSSREKAGLTIEEVADDLKLDLKKVESIEQGSKDAFKDIYELKDSINIYSKYLSLNTEKIMEEFNEFVFDYTSRIPVSEIKQEEKVSEDKIISPYTMEIKPNKKKYIVLIVVIISLVALVTIGLLVLLNNTQMTDVANLI